MPCRAVLCGAVRCCAVFRSVLYILFRTYQVSSEHHSRHRYTTFVYTYFIVASQKMHSQLSSAQLRAQQRSAAQSSTVPCPAVLYRAVPCCAMFPSNIQYQVSCEVQISGTGMYACVYSSLSFLHGLPLVGFLCHVFRFPAK